jgi:PKD repeat protein
LPTRESLVQPPGSRHEINLTVVDDDGAIDSTTKTVTVEPAEPDNQPPTADFTFSPTNPTVGEEVSFDASASTDSDGSVDEYRWDFDGDGSVDETTQSPTTTHTFSTADDYAVKLTVVDDDDATNSTTQTVTVEPAEDQNEPPTADFTFSPTDPETGETVSFDASASTDSDGSVVEYHWDFNGDGTVDETTQVPTTTHTFSDRGDHAVELTIVDDEDATNSTTQTVSVSPSQLIRGEVAAQSGNPIAGASVEVINTDDGSVATTLTTDANGNFGPVELPPGNYTAEASKEGYTFIGATEVRLQPGETQKISVTMKRDNTPPTAEFTFSPTSPTVGEEVSFDASASTDSDGSIVEYRWDFDGDGSVDATTQSPTTTHTFSTAGDHAVTLTVVDDDGATNSTTQTVSVGEATGFIEGDVIDPNGTPLSDATVKITDTSTGTVVETLTTDSNGDVGPVELPTGTYEVTASKQGYTSDSTTVELGEGETVIATLILETTDQNDPPTAAFSFSPTSPMTGETVTFDASESTDSDGSIVEYRWDFDGDGSVDATTQSASITHAFSTAGDHAVELTVVDDDGATDSTTKTVTVEAADDGDVAYYQVDFVEGEPLENLGPADSDNFYSDQHRLVRAAHGSSEEPITRTTGVLWSLDDDVNSCLDSQHFDIEDGTASITFTVKDGCELELSLVSYTKPGPGWSREMATQQELFDSVTKTFGPGTHTLTVEVPTSDDQ